MKGLTKKIFSLIAAGTMVFTYCAVLPAENISVSDSIICASAASSKVNISKCSISLSSTTRIYKTGTNMNNPVVTVKYGSKKLKQGVDYKLKYLNVSNVGTGKVIITGCGNYSGQAVRTFKIIAMEAPKVPYVSSTENTVTLCWNEVYSASKYKVQRYNSSKNAYETIYSGKSRNFTDKGRQPSTSYKYRICAYRVIKGKTYKVYSPSITKKTTISVKSQYASFQNEVIRLVNIERQKQSKKDNITRPNLKYNSELTTLTIQRASQVEYTLRLQNRNSLKFSDHTFNGKDTGDMLNDINYNWFANRTDYYCYGENLAVGYKTPEDVVKAWMDSPGHRANILQPKFMRIGVGYKVINGQTYWVQEFTS